MLRFSDLPIPTEDWAKNIMVRKKIVIFYLAASSFAIVSAAQNPAQELLGQLSASYLAMIPFKLDFELINYHDQRHYQSLTGTYFMANINQFRIDFADQEIIFDGQWLWSYDPNNDQVVVETLDPQSSLTFVFNLLSGNRQAFAATLKKKSKQESLRIIELKSADENCYFKKIFLTIEADYPRLKSAIYYDFKDLKTELQLAKPARIESAEAATLFDPQQFDGKEIIDLRP